jgi:enoyl-CoA hydratase/carnithine racemase
MAFEQILSEVRDRVALITLNQPDRLNAWTRVMEREVRAAINAAIRDDRVRVIVITGAGRGFCAGADVSLLETISDDGGAARAAQPPPEPIEQALDLPDGFKRRYAFLALAPKPVIAAINGPVAGLGLVISLYADFRIAADEAVFTTEFARRGLIAEHGVDWMLARIVGLPHALDLLLSARRLAAAEAQAMGLVNRIVPTDRLMPEVLAHAGELADKVSPRSMRVMKEQVYRALSLDLDQAVAIGDREMEKSFASADFKEGVAHFVEKRPAQFTGR